MKAVGFAEVDRFLLTAGMNGYVIDRDLEVVRFAAHR